MFLVTPGRSESFPVPVALPPEFLCSPFCRAKHLRASCSGGNVLPYFWLTSGTRSRVRGKGLETAGCAGLTFSCAGPIVGQAKSSRKIQSNGQTGRTPPFCSAARSPMHGAKARHVVNLVVNQKRCRGVLGNQKTLQVQYFARSQVGLEGQPNCESMQ